MTEICQCPFVGGHEKYDVDLATQLGMVSHKMSLITIFGYKHFKLKFP